MNLNDLETPPPGLDPTPRSPQQLAAAKRQRQTAPDAAPAATTSHLLFGAAFVVLAIACLIILVSQHGAPPAPRPLVTVEPTFVTSSVAAQEPFSAPTAPAATKETAPATIDAYAAPGGVVLGPIEVTRQMTPIAHYGSAWVQAQVEGSGLVWLRASDVPQLGLIGADLSTSLPPQTGQGMTLVQPLIVESAPTPAEQVDQPVAPASASASSEPLRIRAEDDCNAEHGRCDPPCTAEHGRCAPGDQ